MTMAFIFAQEIIRIQLIEWLNSDILARLRFVVMLHCTFYFVHVHQFRELSSLFRELVNVAQPFDVAVTVQWISGQENFRCLSAGIELRDDERRNLHSFYHVSDEIHFSELLLIEKRAGGNVINQVVIQIDCCDILRNQVVLHFPYLIVGYIQIVNPQLACYIKIIAQFSDVVVVDVQPLQRLRKMTKIEPAGVLKKYYLATLENVARLREEEIRFFLQTFSLAHNQNNRSGGDKTRIKHFIAKSQIDGGIKLDGAEIFFLKKRKKNNFSLGKNIRKRISRGKVRAKNSEGFEPLRYK